MAAVLALVCLGAFAVAFVTYGRWVGRRVYGDDEALVTPAHTRSDGRDYVPTPLPILFGHHFTSIAGAAPIIGPCVAAYWGWLPALLWVVLGTVFIGAVHDFGALVASVREEGRSVADLAAGVLGPRARTLFLSFVLVLTWVVLAVFAMAIAGLFVSQPSSVLPIHVQIVVALVVGWLVYRRGVRPLVPSLVALAVLYAFVGIGVRVPLRLESLGVPAAAAEQAWIAILLLYAAVASVLPVWVLLQPRDYVNSHQLLVGLGLLYAGLVVGRPPIDAPAVRLGGEGAPDLFPLLFVTIACGAISGFHGLVASGTSSKQLDRLSHARAVGYGGMLGEGSLALASTLAAVAGIGLVGACQLPGQGAVADLSWSVYYDSWAHASANKAAAFVLGGGALLQQVGLSAELSRTLMAVLVIAFASTTLDTATRIQRFIVAELGEAVGVRWLTNRFVATAVAVVPAALLAYARATDPVTGASRQVGWMLWPVFGASNQALAALTLLVLALYFAARRRPVWPLLLPMAFVALVTVAALLSRLRTFFAQGNWPLLALASLLLALVLWMFVEGVGAWRRLRHVDA